MSAAEPPIYEDPSSPLFAAFRGVEAPRRWPWVLAVVTVVGVVAVVLQAQQEVRYFQVDTPAGARILNGHMTPHQVSAVLGPPIAPDDRGDDCLRYGRPRFDVPFPLYSVCYERGHLLDVTEKQMMAYRVDSQHHFAAQSISPDPKQVPTVPRDVPAEATVKPVSPRR